MIHSSVTFVSIRLTGIKSNVYLCFYWKHSINFCKTISQIPLVINEERRGMQRPGLCCLPVSTCLSDGVTSEVLNYTHATTMISTSNLFLDGKKEYPMDIKRVKRFLLVNSPPPQNTKWTYNWDGHSIGHSNSPHCLFPIEGGQALRFISNVIIVTRRTRGSLFEVHQSKHGCHSLTAHIWTHLATMETTKEGKIYLFQDSFTGIFKRPVFRRARECWWCARGCCVFPHERPSFEGPEKDSGLVLEPSWKEVVVPLGGTCVAQNLQINGRGQIC